MARILVALVLAGTAVLGSAPAGARTRQAPPPRHGAAVNIEPTSGTTFYREPGQARPSRLTTEIQVPLFTVVDATKGRMGLTSAEGAADFRGGKFVIREPRRQHVTELYLAGGGSRSSCRAGSTKPLRQLWGDGKGRFQTRGYYASATVRGTIWRVQDRCDGTLTTVLRGIVAVRDYRLHRTVLVRAGHSYLARR